MEVGAEGGGGGDEDWGCFRGLVVPEEDFADGGGRGVGADEVGPLATGGVAGEEDVGGVGEVGEVFAVLEDGVVDCAGVWGGEGGGVGDEEDGGALGDGAVEVGEDCYEDLGGGVRWIFCSLGGGGLR